LRDAVLAIVLGSIGFSAWLAKTDCAVIPALLLGIALVAFGLYRRHVAATCGDKSTGEQARP
jgi:hypothetical protein